MVAYSGYHVVDFPWCADRDWRWFCGCSVHLHTLLNYRTMQQDRYKTILVIVTGLLIIGWIAELPWLNYVAAGIGLVSVFIPAAARGIEWAWFKLALALGYVNSRILLSIIYFVFLLPIAWISRMFTRDPLALRNRKTSSLFFDRNHLYTRKDLENIW